MPIPEPAGPQLNDANLTAMSEHELQGLASIMLTDLQAAELLFEDGAITREELRWVQSDAERVRNEIIRREERSK